MDRLLRRSPELSAAVRGEPCLDAETVAAWADGALDARGRAAVEAHAAGCAHCQSLLAMMVRTSDAPRVESPNRTRALGWLIPLAVGAAAVVLWIRLPDRSAPQQPPLPVAKTAAAPAAVEPDRPADRRAFSRLETPPAAQTPGPLERRRDEAERRADARAANEAPRAAAPSRQAAASQDAKAEMTDAIATTIASPDPQSLWRLTTAGVDRSTDGGRTWHSQSTGVDHLLRAGASPAPSVCWLVGRNGTVAVSDGSSWRRPPFPDPGADLVSVQAADDKSAIVTASDGRRFRTSNAGATWTLDPPQEFPAAPF